MKFVHDAPDFFDLLRIVADERGLSPGLVEKDYWVTHSLWALGESGFEVWFKGGTSLSKGFGLIERFSEDLDLKIEPGSVSELPTVSNWRSEGKRATHDRQMYFETLAALLRVPGAIVALDSDSIDKAWRGADFRVMYPGRHLGDLPSVLSPFVRLEVGSARVTPFVEVDLSSYVHDKLFEQGLVGEFDDNRPRAVRCVHPLVTLLEKLDALHRRFSGDRSPATFVRHYEDAARIIAGRASLPPLTDYSSVRALADEMLSQRQLSTMPAADEASITPSATSRWTAIRDAHTATGPMFWGERISIDDACASIREWVASELG